MSTASVGRPRPPGSVFLVERYLPPEAAGDLAASVARAARLCALSDGPESAAAAQVQYLRSTYLPSEDTCFCLFRASTADAVRALNDEADFALDRITAAVQLWPRPTPDGPYTGQPAPD